MRPQRHGTIIALRHAAVTRRGPLAAFWTQGGGAAVLVDPEALGVTKGQKELNADVADEYGVHKAVEPEEARAHGDRLEKSRWQEAHLPRRYEGGK